MSITRRLPSWAMPPATTLKVGRPQPSRLPPRVRSSPPPAPVSATCMGSWRKHAPLIAAARRTAAAPKSEEIIALATHSVTSTHRRIRIRPAGTQPVIGDSLAPPPSPRRANGPAPHDQRRVGTFRWPPAETSHWPPAGTFSSWPRTALLPITRAAVEAQVASDPRINSHHEPHKKTDIADTLHIQQLWKTASDLRKRAWSRLSESNRRPTHYECVALAD